mmetsp:Transcript_25748/g.67412  ORF Transcript_25748/g.67412 Transcript_25748/m.67412 type:complete len:223 (+) Transcript_25748:435-1103(+)
MWHSSAAAKNISGTVAPVVWPSSSSDSSVRRPLFFEGFSSSSSPCFDFDPFDLLLLTLALAFPLSSSSPLAFAGALPPRAVRSFVKFSALATPSFATILSRHCFLFAGVTSAEAPVTSSISKAISRCRGSGTVSRSRYAYKGVSCKRATSSARDPKTKRSYCSCATFSAASNKTFRLDCKESRRVFCAWATISASRGWTNSHNSLCTSLGISAKHSEESMIV